MGNFGNRVGNTGGTAVRLGGSTVVLAADGGNTVATIGKDFADVVSGTTQDLKNVFLGAFNHGKWYDKAGNIVTLPITAVGTTLEGAVRSVVQPVVNGVVNAKNTVGNFFTNIGRSIGRTFSKKPISDFSYDHMKTRELKKKNRFSKLQFGRGKGKSKESESEGAAVVTPVEVKKEEPKKVEKAKKESEKPVEKEEKVEKVEEKKAEKTEEKSEDAELSKINTLPEMAAYLGVKENENMLKHKKDIVEQMKEGKEIKDSLLKYDDEMREIVGKYKGEKFARGNIAMDLLKADIMSEGMKTITDKDKEYKKNMQKYLDDNLATAKSHLSHNKEHEIVKKVDQIAGSKKEGKKVDLNSHKSNNHAMAA